MVSIIFIFFLTFILLFIFPYRKPFSTYPITSSIVISHSDTILDFDLSIQILYWYHPEFKVEFVKSEKNVTPQSFHRYTSYLTVYFSTPYVLLILRYCYRILPRQLLDLNPSQSSSPFSIPSSLPRLHVLRKT